MRSLAALLLLTLPACYHYVPAEPGSAAGGESVRVELSDGGTQHVTPVLGPGVAGVDGMVLRSSSDSVAVLAEYVRTLRRGILPGERAVVRLAAPDILSVQRKELSRTRTAIFTAGLIGGLLLFDQAFGIKDRLFEGEEPTPEPPGPDIRTGFRLPLGFRLNR